MYEFADNSSANLIDPFGEQIYPFGPNGALNMPWPQDPQPVYDPPGDDFPEGGFDLNNSPGPESNYNGPSLTEGNPNGVPYSSLSDSPMQWQWMNDAAGSTLSRDQAEMVAGQITTFLPLGFGKCPNRGIGNPFRGKSPAAIDKMLRNRGFQPRGPNPVSGKGGYVNPKTGRSYHIDNANSFNEPPHVDVNRLKSYNGSLDKKKYPM